MGFLKKNKNIVYVCIYTSQVGASMIQHTVFQTGEGRVFRMYKEKTDKPVDIKNISYLCWLHGATHFNYLGKEYFATDRNSEE